MSEILNQQYVLLRIVEKSLDNFRKIGKKNYTAAKIRSRISSLKETWAQCIQLHASILQSTPAATRESLEYFKAKQFEIANDLFQATLDYMAECLEELEPPSSPHHSTPLNARVLESSSSFSLTHLPPINLPQFSGSFEEWESFRDRFKALIIDNENLSSFARMHFLSSSLIGRASDTISSIPVTADNFDLAWKELSSRFENKRRLVDIHVSSLLNLPTVHRESPSELSALRNQANRAIASLTNLNRSSDEILDDIRIFSVSQKLDPATRKAWRMHSCDESRIPSFEEFDRFLAARVRALEELPPPAGTMAGRSGRARVVNTASVSLIKCVLCGAAHFLNQCEDFKRKTPSQRLSIVKQLKRCINCLSAKHSSSACPSKYSCRTCHQQHHSLLHDDSSTLSASVNHTFSGDPPSSTIPTQASTLSARSEVLLATARVRVSGPSGRSVIVRALIDQGSEISFISERIRQLLKLNRIIKPVTVSAVGGVSAGTCRYAARVIVSPPDASGPSLAATASILTTLTRYLPSRRFGCDAWSHLVGLQLADTDLLNDDPIELLIGADLFGDILLDGLCKGEVGQPVALKTIFGWILSGPSCEGQPSQRVTVQHCAAGESLDRELRRFWEVEDLPSQAILTREEQKCEDHFVTTHSRTPDGRYMVRLPFKSGPPINIGASRGRAERCLLGLVRRLNRQPEVKADYSQCLQEYLELGHMHCVSPSDLDNSQTVYIPHHPAIRDSSSTTRLRVVFNASSLSTNSTSLNDHLLAGPKLQSELSAVILRWRINRYVMSADITKMYRQILIDPRDRSYQCILWTPDNSDRASVFQLNTVTFGTAAAPFLALRVLKQLILDEGRAFPLAVAVLRENTYVDDILFGADDIDKLRHIRNQVRSLLSLGHFELRKWSSNSEIPLQDLEPTCCDLARHKTLQTDDHVKILGIAWSPHLDSFQFAVALPSSLPKTKRSILPMIARIFDPLGWATPVTVASKIFLQKLWLARLDWDETLPPDCLLRWTEIHASLADLGCLRVERWIGWEPSIHACELHGFADASESAYAAVVYIRVVSSSGQITTSLLINKSKVAPVKSWSIPRLELAAASLLARLIEFGQSALQLTVTSCYCWSDSTVVLAWLAQHPAKWKTFVANRVSDIQTRIPAVSWRHVSSHDNPADCASRGIRGQELVSRQLWWRGPSWLSCDPSEWPGAPSNLTTDLEVRSGVSMHVGRSAQPWDLATRFSSWSKLVRVTAYLMRFINSLRHRLEKKTCTSSGSMALASDDYLRARLFWMRSIQSEVFPQELRALRDCQALPSASSLVPFTPFLDADNIIRVGGRLRNASIPFKTKHPILLSAHPVVALLVKSAHLRMLHAGSQLTLATLRQEYWILRARSIVRQVIHECLICVRERAAVPTQLMGNLPDFRVTPPSRAFLHCGLDYAGPVVVRASSGRGVKTKKAYIAIFICMASRAVHLELVEGYATPAFMAAFSRFCSRRGLPNSIYSDNGTTFRGADRELALAFRSAIKDPNFQNHIAGDQISWKFIPPAAPHFGGLWEAGVRSIKHHLKRVLGSQTITFEEFITLLCNIEACLNSRPIAPLTEDIDSFDPLTPGHFLIGSALSAVPEPSVLSVQENRLSRWQLIRLMSERFWRLWTTDYLHTLQQRGKWRTVSTSPVKIGQLVLLRNPGLPPCKWDLGRIIKCHPGSDGLVRVVSVKTAQSEFVRPISKICLLPIDCTPTEAPADPHE